VYDAAAFIVAHYLENKGSEVINERLLAWRDDHGISKEVHVGLV
jgi:hypothetical protein